MTEILVVGSDFHCGSSVALLPPNFELIEGQRIYQNKGQEWLWKCHEDARLNWIPSIVKGDKFSVCYLGDLIEGVHHGTKQVISTEVGDHVRAALEVLSPLAERAEKVFVVKGTECHTGNHELAIAEKLGAEKDPNTGQRAFDRLYLDVRGCRCVFRHHISTSLREWLKASQLSIHLTDEQARAARVGHPVPKVLGCAHRHEYGYFDDAQGACFVSPPWQYLTRFGHKVVSPAVTKPGYVILDWRGLKPGSLPRVHHQAYIPAAPKGVTL